VVIFKNDVVNFVKQSVEFFFESSDSGPILAYKLCTKAYKVR
jgi:hypothetical protein